MINIIGDIVTYAKDLTGAKVGVLPTDEGLVVQLAPSGDGTTYLDGSSSDNMSLLFLCKNLNQVTAMDTLEIVCNTLTRAKHAKIYTVVTATRPNYVDKDGDYWIYSCVVNLKYTNTEVY